MKDKKMKLAQLWIGILAAVVVAISLVYPKVGMGMLVFSASFIGAGITLWSLAIIIDRLTWRNPYDD